MAALPTSHVSAPLPGGPATPARAAPADADGRPRWRSDTLLAGGREACIEHADAVYRLRLTAQGKLILTK